MNTEYRKLLFTQMRLALAELKTPTALTDALIAKAMTANENLASLGCTLNAADVLRLAGSPSLDGFVDSVAELVDGVDAAPMYPDFPAQVMEIPEAQFRMHQLVHYFSTYGLEDMLGVEVRKGWLPEAKDTPKAEQDQRLLALKALELIDPSDAWLVPARRILSKRERMTLPEQEIVARAAAHLTPEQIAALNIPFKENTRQLVKTVFDDMDSEQARPLLRALCKHTGDVLDGVAFLLKTHKYHFRTGQKRMLVKLIESYPVKDWRANVILSNRKAERSLMLLNYLDYGVYSRSPEHMAVVDSLRDGALQSWEGQAKALLAKDVDGALDFIAQRPGMLLRMTAHLLRLGLAPERIAEKLCDSADVLSTQTLMTVLGFFGGQEGRDRAEADDVYDVMEQALKSRLRSAKTPIAGKTVYIDDQGFNLERSELKCNNKSAEGGYVPSGVTYKIPDAARFVRFFVYWNDPERVDVDLHSAALDTDGKMITVGWNSRYKDGGIVSSGDITHSDAAEYIDVDLDAPLDRVAFNIHLFYGKNGFDEIETCFAGLMAVQNNGAEVQLYDPANCFFSNRLRTHCRNLSYGWLDVARRELVFAGMPLEDAPQQWYALKQNEIGRMTVARYLALLLEAQGAALAENREDAEVVLVVQKAQADNELSLIDNNYFMDA